MEVEEISEVGPSVVERLQLVVTIVHCHIHIDFRICVNVELCLILTHIETKILHTNYIWNRKMIFCLMTLTENLCNTCASYWLQHFLGVRLA